MNKLTLTYPKDDTFRELKITTPTITQKMYRSNLIIMVYPDNSIIIEKSRYGKTGELSIDETVPILSEIIANLKLKDTQLDMFKAGLANLIEESINKVLEGDYYERTICEQSARNGS